MQSSGQIKHLHDSLALALISIQEAIWPISSYQIEPCLSKIDKVNFAPGRVRIEQQLSGIFCRAE
jgi:hypothetical protein